MAKTGMNGRKAVTTGTFDGVHRGHLLLLDALRNASSRRGLEPVAITFDRHPLEVVMPERAPKLIMLPDRRDELIRNEGVEVLRLEFNEAVMHLTVAEWMRKMHRELQAYMIMVGYDNTFGCDGRNMEFSGYVENADAVGLKLAVAPELPGVSSTGVRKALQRGDITEANAMLGRGWTLPGVVVAGRKVGRKLGFPTANLEADSRLITPASGVYATTAILPDGSRLPAVTNIGVHPTFGEGDIAIETHIPGFEGDIYGQPMELEFRRRIRGERKFDGAESLRRQIDEDIKAALGGPAEI